jgi:hypothetical protein
MRLNSSHLSLVPDRDVTVHVVLDDFGKSGCVYRETGEADADVDTVIDDIISGSTKTPSASSPSIPPKDERGT